MADFGPADDYHETEGFWAFATSSFTTASDGSHTYASLDSTSADTIGIDEAGGPLDWGPDRETVLINEGGTYLTRTLASGDLWSGQAPHVGEIGLESQGGNLDWARGTIAESTDSAGYTRLRLILPRVIHPSAGDEVTPWATSQTSGWSVNSNWVFGMYRLSPDG